MKLHLPTYLGGEEVEVETELKEDEEIVGWVDEYGTIISSRVNVQMGDLVQIKDREIAALVMRKIEGLTWTG